MIKTKLSELGKVDEYVYEKYYHFVGERMSIFNRRFIEKKQTPWTEDEVFKDYKFCNIHRFLDRNTLFFHNKVYPLCTSNKELLLSVILCRFYNRIETSRTIGYVSLKGDHFKEAMRMSEAIENNGEKTFTSAHMVSSMPGTEQLKGTVLNKSNRFLSILLTFMENIDDFYSRLLESSTIQDAMKVISEFKGIGPFVAMEIVYELHYTRILSHIDLDWCNTGPGCERGIHQLVEIDPSLPSKERKEIYQKVLHIMKEEAVEGLTNSGWIKIVSIMTKCRWSHITQDPLRTDIAPDSSDNDQGAQV